MTSPSTNANSSWPKSLRDPSTLYFQKTSVKRSIIKAYWTVIICAIPLWWYTTSIQRLALPTSRVHSETETLHTLPVDVCWEGIPNGLAEPVRKELVQRSLQHKERWNGLTLEPFRYGNCGDNTLIIRNHNGPESIHNQVLKISVEKHVRKDGTYSRHVVDLLEDLLAPVVDASHFNNLAVQYSSRYRLSFSLLNEDSAAGDMISGWNIEHALRVHITPLLEDLSSLHNFTIESQVQFHAPLAFRPAASDGYWGITREDLNVFVNSAEWILSSSSSNDHVLHFVLFVPSLNARPLYILDNNGQSTESNSFLLPQWGGIIIHNPSSPSHQPLPPADLRLTFATFADQLSALLGIPQLPPSIKQLPESGHHVLSKWQMDTLLRRRTIENTIQTRETLRSIVNLVDQIENMPVGQDVKDDVENALSAYTEMWTGSKSLIDIFTLSADAFNLSSRAFFNPGMLALLYFPTEHKYAVYAPLFASAIIPLFVSALREIVAWKKERKDAKNGSSVDHTQGTDTPNTS
ncbi:hypothetical protein CVT24_002771 [Panaeolus cyanescens]|uniref:GPI transamidase component PIG-S n=1 Tax=Panaeolus cyanescens TaxID=181874 RepID=A0A409VNA6_9AGAR|nr:hypothetical protein CVT24_002771 [Panaeolus cyanescens]